MSYVSINTSQALIVFKIKNGGETQTSLAYNVTAEAQLATIHANITKPKCEVMVSKSSQEAMSYSIWRKKRSWTGVDKVYGQGWGEEAGQIALRASL